MAGKQTIHPSSYSLHYLARVLLVLVGISCLYAVRFSKVEESFQLQAVHDLYYHGITPAVNAILTDDPSSVQALYDHLQFPGVVPRSFIGPLILSLQCRILQMLLRPLGWQLSPASVEYTARLGLLIWSWSGWFRLGNALNRKLPIAGSYMLLITACQFHLVFYASRMLPNVFATVVTLYAFAFWIEQRIHRAAITLVIAMTVFRCDLVLLLFTMGVSWLVTRELTLIQAIRTGSLTLVATLLITVPIDSCLWQHWTWPEGMVFYYNAILNKSSDWGTSPWHWYWTSAIPKALLFGLLLVPLSVLQIPQVIVRLMDQCVQQQQPSAKQHTLHVLDRTWLPVLLPALGYVALYSILPHKEVRFLYPVLPLFNLAAAVGMTRVHRVRFPVEKKSDDPQLVSRVARFLYGGCIAALVLSFMISCVYVAVSRQNYPGGQALEVLAAHIQQQQHRKSDDRWARVRVHMDVATTMTGANKFGERHAQYVTPRTSWTFSKAGYEVENRIPVEKLSNFTHLLSEDFQTPGFQILCVIPGNPRFSLSRSRIITNDAIYVLENTLLP